MKDNYQILTNFLGYQSKADMTATDEGYLVSGSQNMILNEFEKWESRQGYTRFGSNSTDRDRIKSQHVWNTNIGTEIFLREAGGVLEFYSDVTEAWETLKTGLSATYPVRFAEVWNTTELTDVLLFVNHSLNMYSWSGALGTFASMTSNTITINENIGENKFWSSDTRELRIKDDGGVWRVFAYTGISGSQFTGVTPDPTSFTFDSGTIVAQEVRTTANTPASNFTSDTIKVLNNHVYVGSNSSRLVFISTSTSYIDFTFSSPRLPTEGALLTLDDVTTAFEIGIAPQGNDVMAVFSGKSRAYRVDFVISPGADTDRESLEVKPIFTGTNQGAISQEMVKRIKNAIVFLNHDKELVQLANLENFNSFQQSAISDPIKPDFLASDFSNGMLEFWRNSLYISAPGSGKVFILTFRVSPQGETKTFWQTPQILPFGLFSIYKGDLYGHSGAIKETYLAFDGVNDLNNSIAFKAHFAYRNAGERAHLKNFNRYFSELYLSSNAKVNHRLLFEYKGAKSLQEFVYRGDDDRYLFLPNIGASLGVNSLGTNPLGATTSMLDELNKYRRIKSVVPTDFFEFQVQYEMDEIDARMQIVAHGPRMVLSSNKPVKLT